MWLVEHTVRVIDELKYELNCETLPCLAALRDAIEKPGLLSEGGNWHREHVALEANEVHGRDEHAFQRNDQQATTIEAESVSRRTREATGQLIYRKNLARTCVLREHLDQNHARVVLADHRTPFAWLS